TKAEVTVPIMLGHEGLTSTLRAFSRCNLHGIWEGDATVKVE
ncbi:MAG: desulfoferrodoxin family protein, partial [Nitrospinota bacterium]